MTQPLGIVSSIIAKDSSKFHLTSQRQGAVVLKQERLVYESEFRTDIDMLVDQGVSLFSSKILVSIGIEGPCIKVGVLSIFVTANVIPTSNNTGSRIIQNPMRNCDIKYSNGRVGTLELSAAVKSHVTWHGHVQTS